MENVDVYSAIPVNRGDVMISDVISHAQLLNKTMPIIAFQYFGAIRDLFQTLTTQFPPNI